MKAIVLCAGLGTRLRPLTLRWPKPALPFLGRPLIRYAFRTIRQAGIREVGINVHHLPAVMSDVARIEADSLGLNLTIVEERGAIQGTGGGVHGLREFVGRDDVVVMNGDVLFALSLEPVLLAHRASAAPATMVLMPMPEGERYNAVEIDGRGLVRRIAGKGPGAALTTPWHFTGVHVLTPRVFDFMGQGPEDINHDVYVRMMEGGVPPAAHILRQAAPWSDLGTAVRYAATHRATLFGQFGMSAYGDDSPFDRMRREHNSWVSPFARLASDVRISGPAWFGAGCEVGEGARIGAAVSIGRGARVGAGAMLNRVVVLDGADVAAGAVHEDAIVGAGLVVPTSER